MSYNDLSNNELIDIAENFEEAGKLDRAIECWRILLNRDSDPLHLCRLGNLLMELEKWNEAEAVFMSAIELEPNLPNPYNLLGILNYMQEKFEIAQSYFSKSLDLNKGARTYTLLGVTQLEMGLIEEARESFYKAIKIDPAYEEAYYNLGFTYREEPSEAIKLFEKAIDLDPGYSIAHRELGWYLRHLMKLPEALYHLNRAIELDGTDGWSYIYLGNTLWADNDLVSAEETFKKAIEVWPEYSIGFWCLALFYEQQDRYEEASRLYQKGFELDPNDVETNLRFGMFLKQIGAREKAKNHLERVISVEPDNKQARLALSDLK